MSHIFLLFHFPFFQFSIVTVIITFSFYLAHVSNDEKRIFVPRATNQLTIFVFIVIQMSRICSVLQTYSLPHLILIHLRIYLINNNTNIHEIMERREFFNKTFFVNPPEKLNVLEALSKEFFFSV